VSVVIRTRSGVVAFMASPQSMWVVSCGRRAASATAFSRSCAFANPESIIG
jgi:hypothetical protein